MLLFMALATESMREKYYGHESARALLLYVIISSFSPAPLNRDIDDEIRLN